ncbi:MAG: hypothetical protein HZC36_01220 [Armatimonadetes bacterium]|nr:hypothetical protein [Armatimonadota bacterium]
MANRRLLVVVPASLASQANQAAQVWDGAETSEELAASSATFGGLGFSSSGRLPTTHLGCSAVLTEQSLSIALGLLAGLEGAFWATLEGPDPRGTVVGTNRPALASQLSLDFDGLLVEFGLAPVDPMIG